MNEVEKLPGRALYDLTRSQLLIWTGQRLQPDEPLYNMILTFEIRGDLDPDLFQQAFQKLVDCCEAMRLVIDNYDEAPKQVFLQAFDYQVPLVDLSTAASPDSALKVWLDQRRTLRFDLGECLFDSALLRLSATRHVWYFNQHHLATDASSAAILFRLMGSYYDLARAGRLDDGAAVPAYRDYLRLERQQRDSGANARAERYWQERLQIPFQPTSFYRRVPDERSGRTERMTVALGAERSSRLRELAQTPDFQAFTPDLGRFQLFATALFAYLHRISGNRHLAIGTPTHNRVAPILKDTPGLFIELFPVQVEVDTADSFRSLHAKVSEVVQQFLIHTGPGVSGFEHNRAYDVVLNYINAAFGDFAGMPMRSEWVHAGHGDRNHLLRLQIHDFDRADAFILQFDMNVETFVDDEREQAIRHFLALFDALLADPDREVEAVELLSAAERRRLLTELSGSGGQPRPSPGVLERFEAQAAARPMQIALVCEEQEMSYADLNERAGRLAGYLTERGVYAGSRVALFLPRSSELVTAILGVLKCRAAYVPLDPESPPARTACIMEDAGVVSVLAHSSTSARLPSGPAEIICLDRLEEQGHDQSSAPVDGKPTAEDVCYLVYTSGSTGRPKGVIVTHGSLANYIAWASDFYLRDEGLNFPLFSNPAFDLTVTSLFVPLVTGNRLVIYSEASDSREIPIQRVVEDNRVDIVKLTPAHLALMQTLDLSRSRIKRLIVGGEDLKTDLVRSISRRFGGKIEVYNEYGPTEGTVACMVHRYDPERDKAGSVPVGRPIASSRIYLLDDRRHPVPAGVAGEIYIGGVGVAEGYLHDPELTAQRFIDSPFVCGERLYATGDLGRWGPDGVMQYLGRTDDQVKIRGVRVELAEIEAALLEHSAIRDCVVSAVERPDPARDLESDSYCQVCGLSGRHPDAQLDEEKVCRICRVYEQEPDKAHGYFGRMQDLHEIVSRIQAERTGKYDSLALLSGGKDSSYALCKLVEMGLHPLVFTLDNGYISDGAKANIRRLTDSLGLDLHVGSTPVMNEIFVDSLNRHSNVCNGCFKTIYTLSMKLARQHGIRYITTGLSRGQIFETRLADLFRHRIFDPAEIDRTIIEARKAYHRQDDVIARRLDTTIFDDEAIFEEIQFIDFYRYCDASLEEIYSYLGTQAGWVRPADTGRSTNCLINEAGIYVHKAEQGYHNYALPYSWDVRLGHKQRDAAREELDDRIDAVNVRRILAEIGYDGEATAPVVVQDKRLVAYFVATQTVAERELQAALGGRLPIEMVPSRFVQLDVLPLTRNGKVDRAALPEVDFSQGERSATYQAPTGDIETRLAEIWSQVMGLGRVGREDNFFELGGDSILNIQIVSQAKRQGLIITPQQIFDNPTIAELAATVGQFDTIRPEQDTVTGEVPLTPDQRRFFDSDISERSHCNQAVGATGLTPSDFPDAELDQDDLNELLTELGED